ncbi:MAG TPA: hypothetical protein VMR18_02635 [Candidatus Saccharimonadales bacterium]|nr:hypothetical protein [Candidatus Saccharimonadales bacterium]
MVKAEFNYPTPVDNISSGHSPSFSHSLKQQKKNKKNYRLLASIAAVVIVLVIGGVLLHSKNHKPTGKTSDSSRVSPAKISSANSSITKYVSTEQDLNLSFSYPKDWAVSPAKTSIGSSQPITVTSPLVSIINASNASVTGKIVVSVRPSSDGIEELTTSNSAVAAATSQQIGYTSPASDQYQYPYMTFISLSGQNTANSFNEAMLTGPFQFTQDETINAADLTGLDPVISASVYACSTTACTGSGATNLMLTSSTWQNADIFQQTQSIFESFVLN